MLRLPALLLLTVVQPPAQHPEEAIDTPQGRCLVWAVPASDAVYRRCALERPPTPRPNQAMPPSPRMVAGAGSSFRIVVNPDGAVDARLSRPSTRTQDVDFHDEALATIKRWHFGPGTRGGMPVRSMIDLEVLTDERPSDTMPARLTWRYVPGWDHDTLTGTWIGEAPLAPLTPGQVDSVHTAMLRQLATMGIVHPTGARRYCLASSDSGSAAAARVLRIAHAVRRALPDVDTGTCVDTPARVRLLLPRVHHTEQGRVVVYIGGTQLPRWPTGFDAQAWPRWKGRCVGVVRARQTVPVTCEITPDVPWAEQRTWYDQLRQPPARAARSDQAPVTVTVLATMTGAYGIDTLRTRLARVPHFRDFAERDSVASQESWVVWSPVRSDSTAYVVHGDLSQSRLYATNAQYDRTPETLAPSTAAVAPEGPDRFAAFLLGGVGTRPRAPLTLCFGPCVRRYVLDARTHTLQPHIRFRVASMREASRSRRGQLELRVLVDPVSEGLMPLLVIAGPGGRASSVFVLRDRGGGMWDWHVNYRVGDWGTREALIYLVRR